MDTWLLIIIILVSILVFTCCITNIVLSIYMPNHAPNSMDLANTRDLTGKIVIITGANGGIGKQTALVLALSNATIIMACRNIEKASIVQQEIIEEANNENIYVLKLDLSSFKSINAFVKEFKSNYSSLDILMCNAGIILSDNEHKKSVDGFELTFSVNHLGHMHLSLQLKDLMSSSKGIDGKPRLVVTSSIVHEVFRDSFCCCCLKDFDVHNLDKYNNANVVYGQSKLCNIMFAKYFETLYGDDITAVSVHPGIGPTGLAFWNNDNCNFWECLTKIKVLDSTDQLAYTQCWCALTDSNNLKGGEYYRVDAMTSCKSSKGRDIEQCKLLWAKSVEMINAVQQQLLQEESGGQGGNEEELTSSFLVVDS